MKKVLIVLLTTLMCLSLVACSQKEDVPNPVELCDSLQEINEKAGVHIVSPGVMGKENEVYRIIDRKTAAYAFDVNGMEYYIRGTKDTSVDMSGVFKNGKTLFDGVQENEAYGEAEGYKIYRFIIDDKQYIFGINDNGQMSKETFDGIYYEVKNLIIEDSTKPEVKNIIGSYQDSTSQRATMQVVLEDVNVVSFDITWPNSATQYDEWLTKSNASKNITANRFDYSEITHLRVEVAEDGTSTPEILDDYFEGYFEVQDGKVLWSGSGNSETSNCVFEKVN